MERRITTVTVRRHGNLVDVTLPAETRIRMGFEVAPIEPPDSLRPVKRTIQLKRQIELARDILREQADALQELAKR